MLRRHEYTAIHNCETDDFDDNCNTIHPIDSSNSTFLNIMNRLFYLWVFKILKIQTLDSHNVPKLPSYLNTQNSYRKWQNVYNQRSEKQQSVSTLSMLYHTEKQNIITILFGFCYALVLVLFLCWFIFKQYVWPLMEKINDNATNQLANTVIVAMILFILVSTKTLLLVYSRDKIYDMRARIASNLYLYIYEKVRQFWLRRIAKSASPD
eukprot:UN05954